MPARRVPWYAAAGFLVAVWSLPGLLYSVQIYELGVDADPAFSFLRATVHALPVWWVWVPLTPLVVMLARRLPLRRGRWAGPLAAHLAASAAAAVANVLFSSFWFATTLAIPGRAYDFQGWVWALFHSTSLHLYILSYWLVAGATHLVGYERRLRAEELARTRLDAAAARAQVQLLTQQLQPHFLFNALNALSTLILRGDAATSQRMVAALAEFLRATLKAGEGLVPLREELALLETYLTVERVRWGDRLATRIEVEPAAAAALVPGLVLQPLVENAIRHGIAGSEAGGELVVRARRAGEVLSIEVENDGAGLAPDWRERSEERVGLANTRQRLAHLLPGSTLRLEEVGAGRVRAVLEAPYRVAEPAAAPAGARR